MKKENLEMFKRKSDITIEEVKSLNTFKDWDDKKSIELIRIIKTFTEIAYHIHTERKKNGKIIALHIDNQLNIAA
jgi:hypothetical protein